jgi:hypothetical protein
VQFFPVVIDPVGIAIDEGSGARALDGKGEGVFIDVVVGDADGRAAQTVCGGSKVTVKVVSPPA